MNKTVLGLNMKYFKAAFAVSLLNVLSLLFPYLKADGIHKTGFGIAKSLMTNSNTGMLTVILVLTLIAGGAVPVLAAVCAFRPSVAGVRGWALAAAVETAGYTILLFGSKTMLDGTGILDKVFLVKDFGAGFWLALILSYAVLYTSMKIAKVNPGYIVLALLSIIWVFPIVWILLTSFRAEKGYYVGYFIPKGFTLDNYINLFTNSSVFPFARWWMNTFIVAVICCVLNTIIILATAYVLSRTRFKGRTLLMRIMMIIGMFPGFMSMIAVYNILKGIGLAQTLTALVVVGVAGAAMGYYITKGFLDTIPKSLDEAAIIDGANRFKIFTRITVPLAKPIIIYTALTSFLGPWSDYIFPSMLFGDKQASYTVAVGLKWLTDYQRIDTYYTQFAAGSILVALPIVILFICLQRFYVEGLSGSVKG